MPWRNALQTTLTKLGLALLALVAPLMLAYDLLTVPGRTVDLLTVPGQLADRLPAVVVVIVFWVFSGALLLRRGQQFVVRLLYVHSQVLALTEVYPLGHPSPWDPPGLLRWTILGFYFLAPVTLHLHLTFPVYFGSPRSRRRALAAIYLAAAAAALTWMVGYPPLQRLGELYTIATFTASVILLVYAYIFRAGADSRRRLRVICLGTLAGILPTNVLFFVPGLYGLPQALPAWAVSLLLVAVPLSYIYAITRENLFGIDRWLNRSLVSVLLIAGIFLAYLGPLFYLYQVLPGDWLVQALVSTGLTLLIGWNFTWLRTRVERFTDRLFYGGWYDYPGVVDRISDALSRSLEPGQVSEVLTRRVPQLMQLGEGRLVIGAAAEAPTRPLNRPGLAFHFTLQDGAPAHWWVAGHRDGEDFSAEDRRILKTLAQQAEIALNNVSLVEALRRQLSEIRSSREQLARMQRQMLRSREDERARMARDLHDGPLQTLVGLNLQLGILLAGGSPSSGLAGPPASPGVADSLADMRVEVRGLLTELRQVCSELRPPLLDMLGLGAAIQTLAQDWSAQHGRPAQVELSTADWRKLPDEVAVNLYRVAQEALTNIARHAGAESVCIRLDGEPDCLALMITDDGCGFDPQAALAQPAENGHYGLAGMRERVDLIGGVWNVRSTPGAGATIAVAWPR